MLTIDTAIPAKKKLTRPNMPGISLIPEPVGRCGLGVNISQQTFTRLVQL